jgi:hypothetical protein
MYMCGTSKNDNLDNVPDIVRAQTDKGFMQIFRCSVIYYFPTKF